MTGRLMDGVGLGGGDEAQGFFIVAVPPPEDTCAIRQIPTFYHERHRGYIFRCPPRPGWRVYSDLFTDPMPTHRDDVPPWSTGDEPGWMAQVRDAFTERLPDRMEAVRVARSEVRRGALTDETVAALFRSAHDVSGTAESLGGTRLGRAAAAVARRIDPRSAPPDRHGEALADLPDLLDEMLDAAAQFQRWMGRETSLD